MRASAPRRPGFLGPLPPAARDPAAALPASFARAPDGVPAPAAFLRDVRAEPGAIRPAIPPPATGPAPARTDPPPELEGPFPEPAAPPPPERLPPEYLSRLALSIDTLRLHAERLTELCAEDALAVGTAIARRILEAELRSSPAALDALVRSAVRKVGESRDVTVRLAPADAASIRAAGSRFAADLPAATVRVVDDPALGPGDVRVDADFGTVDGRLETRLDEARRALAALADAGGAP
jgi:flagellar assembly protein FliH